MCSIGTSCCIDAGSHQLPARGDDTCNNPSTARRRGSVRVASRVWTQPQHSSMQLSSESTVRLLRGVVTSAVRSDDPLNMQGSPSATTDAIHSATAPLRQNSAVKHSSRCMCTFLHRCSQHCVIHGASSTDAASKQVIPLSSTCCGRHRLFGSAVFGLSTDLVRGNGGESLGIGESSSCGEAFESDEGSERAVNDVRQQRKIALTVERIRPYLVHREGRCRRLINS